MPLHFKMLAIQLQRLAGRRCGSAPRKFFEFFFLDRPGRGQPAPAAAGSGIPSDSRKPRNRAPALPFSPWLCRLSAADNVVS